MVGVDVIPRWIVTIMGRLGHRRMVPAVARGLATALVLSGAGAAWAKFRVRPPAVPSVDHLNDGLAPKQQAYAPDDSESFMQTWNAYYRSDDGHHVFANVALSHLGIGSTCGLNLAVTTPAGRTMLETQQLDGEKFLVASKSAVKLECGKTRMTGSGGTLRIQGELATMALDVTVEQGAPGVDTGTLWLDGDRQRFARYNVPHPRSRMQGRLKYGGKWHELRGVGAVEQFVTNHGLEKFSRIWHRVRVLTDGVSLVIGGFSPTDDYSAGVYFAFIMDGDKVLHVSNDVKIRTLGRKAHSGSGYKVPTAIEVTADDGRLKLNGVIRRTGLIGQFDVLSQLNPFFRLIVRTFFANPWIFRNRSDVKVSWQLDGGPERSLQTEGMHEIIYVNE